MSQDDGMAFTPAGRDFNQHPYSDDEMRVAQWLHAVIPEIGTGEDPIGFLLSSYAMIMAERNAAQAALERIIGIAKDALANEGMGGNIDVFSVILERDEETKEIMLPIPQEIMDIMNWSIGDTVVFNLINGKMYLKKA